MPRCSRCTCKSFCAASGNTHGPKANAYCVSCGHLHQDVAARPVHSPQGRAQASPGRGPSVPTVTSSNAASIAQKPPSKWPVPLTPQARADAQRREPQRTPSPSQPQRHPGQGVNHASVAAGGPVPNPLAAGAAPGPAVHVSNDAQNAVGLVGVSVEEVKAVEDKAALLKRFSQQHGCHCHRLHDQSSLQELTQELKTHNARPRFAVLYGNGVYNVLSDLHNPPNDAKDMGELLEQLGFDTTICCNGTRVQMYEVFESFLEKVRQAVRQADPKNAPVIFFFFSGHGGIAEVKSQHPEVLCEVDYHRPSGGMPLQYCLDEIRAIHKDVLCIAAVDACRSWAPAARDMHNGHPVEIKTKVPTGTVVFYSSGAGTPSYDGEPGRNGVFTEALLNSIQGRHMTPLYRIFQRVKQQLEKERLQSPVLVDNSSAGDFMLHVPPAIVQDMERLCQRQDNIAARPKPKASAPQRLNDLFGKINSMHRLVM